MRLDTVWLRVPLFAGDVDDVDRARAGRIVPLGATSADAGRGRDAGRRAADRRCRRPPASISFYTRGRIATGRLRPGQRVSVRVPLRTQRASSLVVPRAAVLHDAFGGTWVYEARDGARSSAAASPLADIVGDTRRAATGPPAGTRVVTAGAAELFGTEFGVGK